jgi:5-methylcytosine-specific restriction endonuclease McrA
MPASNRLEVSMAANSKWRRYVVHHLVARDGNLCSYCGVGLDPEPADGVQSPTTRTVDHIVPRAAGGTGHWWNLRLACPACNNQKADLPLAMFIERQAVRP